MTNQYVELHCHSNYSFQEGASSIYELLIRAEKLGYKSLALTDHDNLCGAMEFSQTANSIGIRPITGAEITLQDGSHLIFLAETTEGYSNLCNLITHTRINGDRLSPNLDPKLLEPHSKGLILLTGCSRGNIPNALTNGHSEKAEDILKWVPKKTHNYKKLIKPEELINFLEKNKMKVVDTTGLIFNPNIGYSVSPPSGTSFRYVIQARILCKTLRDVRSEWRAPKWPPASYLRTLNGPICILGKTVFRNGHCFR